MIGIIIISICVVGCMVFALKALYDHFRYKNIFALESFSLSLLMAGVCVLMLFVHIANKPKNSGVKIQLQRKTGKVTVTEYRNLTDKEYEDFKDMDRHGIK